MGAGAEGTCLNLAGRTGACEPLTIPFAQNPLLLCRLFQERQAILTALHTAAVAGGRAETTPPSGVGHLLAHQAPALALSQLFISMVVAPASFWRWW